MLFVVADAMMFSADEVQSLEAYCRDHIQVAAETVQKRLDLMANGISNLQKEQPNAKAVLLISKEFFPFASYPLSGPVQPGTRFLGHAKML